MCIAESGGRLTVGGMNASYHRGAAGLGLGLRV